MIPKSFPVKSVCILCVLVAVMILVGGCGTNESAPTVTISLPTATSTNVPTPLPVSETLQIGASLHFDNYVGGMAFSPDGKILALGSCGKSPQYSCEQAEILLLDTRTHQPIGQPLLGHTEFVGNIAFSPNGKVLASGSKDGTIILWDWNARQPLTRYTYFTASVAFSPDGKMLASGGVDGAVSLYDIASRQKIEIQGKGRSYPVSSVAFSPDGKTLVGGSYANILILSDVATQPQIDQWLTGHTSNVDNVVFSPDGKMLASASLDNTIILWDVSNPQSVKQQSILRGLGDQVWGVIFNAEGGSLALASRGKSIILWDVSNPQKPMQLRTLDGHNTFVKEITISPDGKMLASASDENTVILWDLANPRQPTSIAKVLPTRITTPLLLTPDTRIQLDDSCGWYNCSKRITILADGSFTCQGNCPTPGSTPNSNLVSREQIQQMLTRASEIDFFSITQSAYTRCPRGCGNDRPYATITIQTNGKTHSVERNENFCVCDELLESNIKSLRDLILQFVTKPAGR